MLNINNYSKSGYLAYSINSQSVKNMRDNSNIESSNYIEFKGANEQFNMAVNRVKSSITQEEGNFFEAKIYAQLLQFNMAKLKNSGEIDSSNLYKEAMSKTYNFGFMNVDIREYLEKTISELKKSDMSSYSKTENSTLKLFETTKLLYDNSHFDEISWKLDVAI